MTEKAELPSITSRALTYLHDIPILRTKKFWEGLRDGKVYATRCRKCGKLYFPPQVDCSNCLTSDVEWVQLNDKGVIETFTEIFLKPQGFTHYESPYIIAIARTSEGVKIMGWLEGIEAKDAKVGMDVRVTIRMQPDGFPLISLRPPI